MNLGFASGLFALCAVLIHVGIVLRIKRHHPNIWQKLGSPGPLYDPSNYGSLRLRSFIWRREWIPLGDVVLTLLCVSLVASICLMVVALGSAVLMAST